MVPTILITSTHPTNAISPNIALSDLSILESTQTTQDKTTTPNNAAAVKWDKLSQHQITMNSAIDYFTRQYFDAYKRTFHIADSFWK